MSAKLSSYPTARLAHAKINSLEERLGLPKTQAIEYFFDKYLARIDELEEQVAASPNPAPAAHHAWTNPDRARVSPAPSPRTPLAQTVMRTKTDQSSVSRVQSPRIKGVARLSRRKLQSHYLQADHSSVSRARSPLMPPLGKDYEQTNRPTPRQARPELEPSETRTGTQAGRTGAAVRRGRSGGPKDPSDPKPERRPRRETTLRRRCTI